MPQRWTTCFAAVLVVASSVAGVAQPESIEELRARAEQGDAEAQFNLAAAYEYGRGVSEDDVEALRWHQLAAEQGHAYSQWSLAESYRAGRNVPKDYVRAHMWYNLAAARGSIPLHTQAWRELRDSLELTMTRDQIAEAQRLAREWDEAHPQ